MPRLDDLLVGTVTGIGVEYRVYLGEDVGRWMVREVSIVGPKVSELRRFGSIESSDEAMDLAYDRLVRFIGIAQNAAIEARLESQSDDEALDPRLSYVARNTIHG